MKDVLLPLANKTIWLGDGMKHGGGALGRAFAAWKKSCFGGDGFSVCFGPGGSFTTTQEPVRAFGSAISPADLRFIDTFMVP